MDELRYKCNGIGKFLIDKASAGYKFLRIISLGRDLLEKMCNEFE